MEEIYLIIEHGGNYEDVPYEIGFVLDKNSADKQVAELTNEYKIALEHKEKIDIARQQIQSEFTFPVLEKINTVPRWQGGLSKAQITDEMKAERARITSENEEIQTRNSEKIKQHYDLINEKLKPFYDEIPDKCKSYFNKVNFHMSVYLNKCEPYTYSVVKKLD